MSAAKMYYEIFREFEAASKRQDKVDVLRKYSQDKVFLTILVASFHPDVQFYPLTLDGYRPSDAPQGMGYASMAVEIQRLYVFQHPIGAIRDAYRPYNPKTTDVSEAYRQKMLLQVLESFEAKEAEVFYNMLQKDLRIKGLTSKIVNEAIPGLLP